MPLSKKRKKRARSRGTASVSTRVSKICTKKKRSSKEIIRKLAKINSKRKRSCEDNNKKEMDHLKRKQKKIAMHWTKW